MELFKLFGTILIDNEKANESLHKTDEAAEKTGNRLVNMADKAGNAALKLQAGILAVQGILMGFAGSAASAADRVDKMSQKIGISRQAFQEFDYILGQNGASVEGLQVGMKTLVSRMDEAVKGAGKGAEAFERLKVKVTDSAGKMKRQEQVFEETVKALMKLPEGIEKSRLAFELFGKQGLELRPMLNGTAESFDQLKQRAHELGLVMSDEAVSTGAAFGDMVDDLKKSVEAIKNQVGIALMPKISKIIDRIMERLPQITDMVLSITDAAGNLIITLIDFNDALGGVPAKLLLFIAVGGKSIGVVANMVKGVGEMHSAYKDFVAFAGAGNGIAGLGALLTNPFTLALAGVMALVGGLALLIDKYQEMRKAQREAREAEIDEQINKRNFYKLSPDKQKMVAERMRDNEYFKSIGQSDYYGYYAAQQKKEDFEKKKKPHGSHAQGLSYVPFDGYRAELHRGERVLTAEEARKADQPRKGDGAVNVHIAAVYMRDAVDIDKLIDEIERKVKNKQRALGRS